MGLISEFKEFIIKGNAIDIAVGIIIGAAFGAAVTSLVTDVFMPPIGYLMGGVDFSARKLVLLADGAKHPVTGNVMKEVAVSYGKLINAVIALLVQGFAVFMVVKAINSLKRKEAVAPSAPTPPTKDQVLLTEIRDALARR